jgi:hypothetical protein
MQINGWSQNRIHSYRVKLVTDAAEMARAQAELTSGRPSTFVILKWTSAVLADAPHLL